MTIPVGPEEPERNGKTDVGSRKILKPVHRTLGKTFTRTPLSYDPSAISLPVIPAEDSQLADLDTMVPIQSIPLRCYPGSLSLNSLLLNQTDLQRTHLDNFHGRSESGKLAGKLYNFLAFISLNVTKNSFCTGTVIQVFPEC